MCPLENINRKLSIFLLFLFFPVLFLLIFETESQSATQSVLELLIFLNAGIMCAGHVCLVWFALYFDLFKYEFSSLTYHLRVHISAPVMQEPDTDSLQSSLMVSFC